MKSERTRTSRTVIGNYLQHQQGRPIDAVTFDTFHSTESAQRNANDYNWLCSMVRSMPDEEVARRMKKTRSDYSTIEDALVDKLIMEGL
jgi:hypothetical protein